MNGVRQVDIELGEPGNPRVFAYLVSDDEGRPHLIDTGIDRPAALTAIEAALADDGRTLADIRSITVTHLHGDHLGLAATIRRASGAPVALHPADADALGQDLRIDPATIAGWGVPDELVDPLSAMTAHRLGDIPIDVRLADGDLLDIPGRAFRVLHTPGHTAGHVCIVSDEDRLVLTGDHLLPDQFPGVGLGGTTAENPLRDYRRSLGLLRDLDGCTALPGHGWTFDGIASRVDETLAHHRRRTDEVAAVLGRDPGATIWQIASQLTWSAGWANLSGMYLLSAVRQTSWHAELA